MTEERILELGQYWTDKLHCSGKFSLDDMYDPKAMLKQSEQSFEACLISAYIDVYCDATTIEKFKKYISRILYESKYGETSIEDFQKLVSLPEVSSNA